MTQLFRLLAFVLCSLAASAQAADDSPLFKAAREGDEAEVKALLAKGANVNVRRQDAYADTPLLAATFWQQRNIAALLLANGADANAKNRDGSTPLELAMWNDDKYIAELLLTNGADVNARSLLHTAAHYGKRDFAELFLANGAKVDARDSDGMTPLHRAAQEGHKDIAELLLANGADVNARDKSGSTPLHSAAFSGQRNVAEWLLAKGADVSARDRNGDTPWYYAVLGGQSDTPALTVSKKDVAKLLEEYILKQMRGNPRAAVLELTVRLKDEPDDTSARRLIIILVSEMKPAPAIPEEARKHFVEGTTIVKAGSQAQQALAAQSFIEALIIAPWWDDAYYNLGAAQELAGKYDEAAKAFNFYLLSNPGETEKREVQDRIYALGAKRKLSGAK